MRWFRRPTPIKSPKNIDIFMEAAMGEIIKGMSFLIQGDSLPSAGIANILSKLNKQAHGILIWDISLVTGKNVESGIFLRNLFKVKLAELSADEVGSFNSLSSDLVRDFGENVGKAILMKLPIQDQYRYIEMFYEGISSETTDKHAIILLTRKLTNTLKQAIDTIDFKKVLGDTVGDLKKTIPGMKPGKNN